MARIVGLGVIDDDQMLLEGMAAWLRQVPDLRVLRTGRTVSEFLDAGPCASEGLQVVLLDLNLRDQSVPADNVARLCARGCRVLMVSAIAEPEHVLATIEAGAAGYITKDHDLAALAVSSAAGRTSVLTAQRVRPAPWVHANLKVPVSSSRASNGAPMNAPTSTGTANIRLDTVCAPPLCSTELLPPQ